MKAALVLRGGPKVPDLAKATRLGVKRLYWEAEDPQIDTALFDAIRAKGFQVGIMRDPHWHNDTAVNLAARLSSDLDRLGSGGKQCAVLADIEIHSSAYVTEFIKGWRTIRPTRETAWTMEPFQGGWMEPELVNTINADVNIQVIPQAYFFDMARADPDEVRVDILERGINCARFQTFYGPPYPRRWQGILYNFIAVPG